MSSAMDVNLSDTLVVRRGYGMSEVKLKRGEGVDKALRRLKKMMDKEGTLKDIRNRRYYEKPSEVKRRMAKRPRR